MKISFRVVRVGELFSYNGNLYYKKSTRTAVMMSNNRTFYIEQLGTCLV
jgi:hypothetical protein